MKKLIFILAVFTAVFAGSLALAQNSAPEVVFPVSDLGGCKDKAECFSYCEIAENQRACLTFAKNYQLLPEEEIRVAEKVQSIKGGPGGCDSQASCHRYCDDVAHINECVQFAEENGLMGGQELEEAKKIRAVLDAGGKLPGGCKNKAECERYCEESSHMEECLQFAEDAGFIPPEELEQAKKFIPLMKSGETPGGCKSKNECEAYCETDANFEECMSFAERHGMIPEKERKNIEAFKRAGGKGPGGCRGRQCEAFCQNPENQEACFTWAKENGVLAEEDLSRMEEGRKHMERALSEAPPEVAKCLEEALGPEVLEKFRSGGFLGGAAAGERMSSCFQNMRPQRGQEEGGFGSGEEGGMGEGRPEFKGPGGCQNPDECQAYCENNPDACKGFMPERRGEEGQFQGRPGGFDTPGRMMRPVMPGSMPEREGEYREEFNREYNRQYEGEFDGQSREQTEREFQDRSGEFPPPPEMQSEPMRFENIIPVENSLPSESTR